MASHRDQHKRQNFNPVRVVQGFVVTLTLLMPLYKA